MGEEEEVNKAKDGFEGWDRPGEWSVDDQELEEVAEEEVERRMREREGQMDKQGKWGEWLNKRM